MGKNKRRSDAKKIPKTIRFRLMMYFSVLIIVLLFVIISINFSITTRIQRDNTSTYSQQIVEQAVSSIDSELRKFEISSRVINNNDEIQQLAYNALYKKYGLSAYQEHPAYPYRAVINIINVVGNVNSVALYFGNGKEPVFFGDAAKGKIDPAYFRFAEETFAELRGSKAQFLWSGDTVFKGQQVFLLARNIVSTTTLEPVGKMLIQIDTEYLRGLLHKTEFGREHPVFITDSKGRLLAVSDDAKKLGAFSPGQTLAKESLSEWNKNEFFIAQKTSSYTGWTVTSLIPLSEMNRQIMINQVTLVLIGLGGILISLVISVIIARRIAAPIERLRSSMQEAESTATVVQYEDNTFLETKELGTSFVRMMRNRDELVARVYESELLEKEAELSALQAQINPHFLYNALNTINYMLLIEDKPEISRMVVYLGDILRYAIEQPREIIPLQEDLRQMEKYLYIQKIRFEDNFNYTFKISEEAVQCYVLKLLIQPLVENAIVHGLDGRKGSVHVSAQVNEKEQLVICVEDDGKGMSDGLIKAVLSDAGQPADTGKHQGMGIYNVKRRIQLYYGRQYSLFIKSTPGSGTRITIVIPALRNGGGWNENFDRR